MTVNEESTRTDSDTLASQKQSRQGLPEPEITLEDAQVIAEAEALFDQMCLQRHEMGRSKYGNLTFLHMPTLEMALEELADLANYARYTFVKVALVRQQIKNLQEQAVLSQDGFHTMDEVLGITKKEV